MVWRGQGSGLLTTMEQLGGGTDGPSVKRRGRRILLGVVVTVAVLVTAGGVGYAVFSPQIGALLAARDFCTAIQSQNYSKAYEALAPDLQRRVPRDAFITISTRGDDLEGQVTDCSVSGVDVSADRQSVALHAVVSRARTGQARNTLDLAYSNGAWKISSPPDPLLMPLTTAYLFCQSLTRQHYDAAFQLLAVATQAKLGNSLAFQAVLNVSHIVTGSIKDCQVSSVALSGNQESLTVKSTLLFEHFPNLDTQLIEVQESPGAWSVSKLTLYVLGQPVTIPSGA
jgi:hypothetical protein